jgi:ABC-type transport system involved in cytochrome c biogenesis permease component
MIRRLAVSVAVSFAVFRREWATYFRTSAGWTVLALFLALQGLVFWMFVQFLGRPDAPPGGLMEFFFGGTILYWIAVALLATVVPMRLFAEERRSGTIEPLLTAPVSAGEVVLGKWLAAFAFYLSAWAPTAFYLAYLHLVGAALDPGPIAAGYLGTALLGAAALAVGLLASASTRNQLVAAALSFAAFFGTLLIGALEAEVRDPGRAAALHHLSLFRMMEDFGHGIVDSRPIVLLATVTVLALAATVAAVDRLRGPVPLDAPRGRQLARGISTLLLVVLALLANDIASHRYARGDWTRASLYALSDKTAAILRNLPRPVEATVFLGPRREGERARFVAGLVRELAERCAGASGGQFGFEIVDPVRAPDRAEAAARRYGIGAYDSGRIVVVFTSGARAKVVTEDDLLDPQLDADGEPAPGLGAWRGEAAFVFAILTVTDDRAPRICFTEGHGEPAIESLQDVGYATFAQSLRGDGDEVTPLDRISEANRAGCRVLVLAEPKQAYEPVEVAALAQFVEGGGRLLAMLGPMFSADGAGFTRVGLEAFAARYGVRLGANLVVDPGAGSDVEGPSVWAAGAESYGPHPISARLGGRLTFWPRAREVAVAETPPVGLTVSALVRSSAGGWGETDLATIRGEADLKFDPARDRQGPVTVAVAVDRPPAVSVAPIVGSSGPSGLPATRLVFLGSGRLVMNYRLAGVTLRDYDADFVLGAVAWLSDREPRIGIGPKVTERIALSLTAAQVGWAFRLFVLALPLCAIAGGALTWWRRRV